MPSPCTDKPKVEVFRIQDRSGRGPWRPGFSTKWVDPERTDQLPNIFSDFGPAVLQKIRGWQRNGLRHCGCACMTVPQLLTWFSFTEFQRLLGFDFTVVCLSADVIISKSESQVVFARQLPFTIIKHPMVECMADLNKYKIIS